MPGGRVTFRPRGSTEAQCAVANIGPDGRFQPLHACDWRWGGKGPPSGGHRFPLGGDRETAGTTTAARVDARYGSYSTSGLEFEVTDQPSSNQFEITVDRERASQ